MWYRRRSAGSRAAVATAWCLTNGHASRLRITKCATTWANNQLGSVVMVVCILIQINVQLPAPGALASKIAPYRAGVTPAPSPAAPKIAATPTPPPAPPPSTPSNAVGSAAPSTTAPNTPAALVTSASAGSRAAPPPRPVLIPLQAARPRHRPVQPMLSSRPWYRCGWMPTARASKSRGNLLSVCP